MILTQINALVASGKSETLEFKITTGSRRGAAAIICAMSNQCRGQVLFGIIPDGVLVGQGVSERTLEDVSA